MKKTDIKFKVDFSARKSRKYFDSYYNFNLVSDQKDYYFDEVKELISKGEKQITIYQSSAAVIECELREDIWYDGFIPYVIKSNHFRFVAGTRFDYGFMMCAIKDGFTIIYNKLKK